MRVVLTLKSFSFVIDYSKGFGGKFGVQEDRKDKCAVGWDYVETPQKHESQVDHKIVSRFEIFFMRENRNVMSILF